jgi:hypothetical protein
MFSQDANATITLHKMGDTGLGFLGVRAKRENDLQSRIGSKKEKSRQRNLWALERTRLEVDEDPRESVYLWMGYLQATGGRQLAFYGWSCGRLIGALLLYYLTSVIEVVTCNAKTDPWSRWESSQSGISLDPTQSSRVKDVPNPIFITIYENRSFVLFRK